MSPQTDLGQPDRGEPDRGQTESGELARDRRAGRVLVIDQRDCVLLLRGFDSSAPERGTWWMTPGGGVEAGESTTDAARRELVEETGVTAFELTGPVHERNAEFEFEGVFYRQVEQYFVARIDRFEPGPAGWTEMERRSLLGSRWWSAAELEATSETVYPERLGALIRRLTG